MINTELFKETMTKIRSRLDGEKSLFVRENIPVYGASEDETIDNLIEKASDTTFRLLVMGRFSAGKSAFINVLLGEKLLPEGALPMTALITEIYYGSQKKVIMHPRPGKWKGGNQPFEIEPTLSEIKKYSILNNNSGINKKEANRIDSCFEKMVVYWPLDMLKDGVSIIDSPGTDDPYSNDYIVEAYVPKADAILYCIAGTQAYNATDKNTLERINSMGFHNPLIVTTYFDVVTDGMEESERQEYINTTYQSFYSRHTTRECTHYLNSKLGMLAKQNQLKADFVESGYYELEQFLGRYLTEYKGKEKVSGITSMTDIYNRNQLNRLNGMVAGLDAPLDEFNKRLQNANNSLEQAKLQGELLVREFKVEVKKAKDDVMELIPSLYWNLYNGINLENFEPDTNFSLWSPKKSSGQIAEECSKEIELRMKGLVSQWNTDVFQPKITESFKSISSRMKEQFERFDADISGAQVSLSVDSVQADVDVKKATRLTMFAYALFTGDWITALMGGIFGVGAFGRTLACQFAAGFVLGIVALFTPVGLPALVIAALAGLFGGAAWNASVAASSIKKKTVETTKKQLEKDRENVTAKVTAQCIELFDNAEVRLKAAIDEDIEEVKKNIEIIRKEREDNAHRIEERKAALNEVIDYLKETNSEMNHIRKEFNII